MKKWRKKVQKFFARPGVLKWTIVLVTLVIVVGAIKALLWTIYTKDKPAFVPENVRQDIQGAIKEGGEAIKRVSEPIGSAIVDAGYVRDCGCNTLTGDGQDDETANWQTYTDPATEISMKYPEGWAKTDFVVEGGLKTYELWAPEALAQKNTGAPSTIAIDLIDISVLGTNNVLGWVRSLNEPVGMVTNITEFTLKDRSWVMADQAGDPDHRIYVSKFDNRVILVSATFPVFEEINEILENISAN